MDADWILLHHYKLGTFVFEQVTLAFTPVYSAD